ncbi:hypothetical protein ABTJ81_20030, partial [Acinetobacter baumannii]
TEPQHDREAAELVEAAAASDSLAISDDVMAEDIVAEDAMNAAVAPENVITRSDEALEAAATPEIVTGFAEMAENISFDAAAEA